VKPNISAEVVADSVSPTGDRLTTIVARYPRYIHAELMTHRVFSRNASSSRAIPVRKVLKAIVREPARPVFWGKNQAGMQAAGELQGWRRWVAEKLFMGARYPMVGVVWALNKLGLHKQLANRLLEPWSHITVLITATEWENFFALRLDPAAQPEMQELALQMFVARFGSEPRKLDCGEWHLPFVHEWERTAFTARECVQMSVARCARISYLAHDGQEPVAEKDFKLHDDLVGKGHMSPTEHQGTPIGRSEFVGNFRGWRQYRKTIPGEAVFKRAA
jgi:hypothetical protein